MSMNGEGRAVRVALPSKGQLEEPTLDFLARCGMRVSKTNPRQYIAKMPAFPEADVLFQRPTDIFAKIRDGDVALGITGFDVVNEGLAEGDEVVVLDENLGYGGCDLVLAVPEGWLDVNCVADLADLALAFRDEGRPLRIATKYPNLVRGFLYERGINHFTLAESEGAMEAAPAIGYADLIADITSSGTTLRENHLKQLDDGTILHSDACLIGHRPALLHDERVLDVAHQMLELIEAYQRGRRHLSLLANIACSEPARISAAVARRPVIGGLRGPAIAPIYSPNGDCIAVTVSIVVREDQLREVVRNFREIGSMDVIVQPVHYIFSRSSEAYDELLKKLGRRPGAGTAG